MWVRRGHPAAEGNSSEAIAEQLMKNLDTGPIGEHELSFPPIMYPRNRLDRRDKLQKPIQTLERVILSSRHEDGH